MTIALVAHTTIDGQSVQSATSAGINTTGASLLVVSASTYNPNGPGDVTDSKSNTWHQLTIKTVTGRYDISIWYAINPTVGTAHTFTWGNRLVSGGGASYFSATIAAFSGVATTTPFDVQNGAVSAASDTSLNAGSVTPTNNNSLVVSVFGIDDPNGNTIANTSGLTITDTVDGIPGARFGNSMAYVVQTTATAVNPHWTRSTTNSQSGDAAASAVFIAASGGGGTNSTLTAAQGSYGLTGEPTIFEINMPVTQGSFALTGEAVLFHRAVRLVAAQGSFALTGEAVAFIKGHILTAAQGSFGLTGEAVLFHRAVRLVAAQGSFGITGEPAVFEINMPVTQGSFALTGEPALFHREYLRAAAFGTFALTGEAVLFHRAVRLPIGPGLFNLVGEAASGIKHSGSTSFLVIGVLAHVRIRARLLPTNIAAALSLPSYTPSLAALPFDPAIRKFDEDE